MSGSMQPSRSSWPVSSNTAAATDEEEVLVAGLGDALLVLGELGVALDQLDLAAVDAAGLVAPVDEDVGASKSSWFRPGRPTNPGSEIVPIWISSLVTPCAVSSALSPSAGSADGLQITEVARTGLAVACSTRPAGRSGGRARVATGRDVVVPRESTPATSDSTASSADEASGAATTRAP